MWRAVLGQLSIVLAYFQSNSRQFCSFYRILVDFAHFRSSLCRVRFVLCREFTKNNKLTAPALNRPNPQKPRMLPHYSLNTYYILALSILVNSINEARPLKPSDFGVFCFLSQTLPFHYASYCNVDTCSVISTLGTPQNKLLTNFVRILRWYFFASLLQYTSFYT